MSGSIDDLPVSDFAEAVHGPAPLYKDYMALSREVPFKGTSMVNLHRNDNNWWRQRAVLTRPNETGQHLRGRILDLMEKWELYEPVEFSDNGVITVVFVESLLPRFRMELDELKNPGLAKTQLGYFFSFALSLGYHRDSLPSGFGKFLPPGFNQKAAYKKGKAMRENGRVWKGGRMRGGQLWYCTHEWPVDLEVE